MTLVAVLKMSGIEYTTIEESNGGACWLYEGDEIQALIISIVSTYNQNSAKVEAREFTKKLAMVRKDMYSFLDGDDGKDRRRKARF